MAHLLGHLALFPGARFLESDLSARCAEGFARLVEQRLLRFVQTDPDQATYPCPTPWAEGCDRVVSRVEDRLWAVCTCPANEPPIPLSPEDLNRWRVDLQAVTRRFREANGLRGNSEDLDGRMFFLGETQRDGLSNAFALGLIDDREAVTRLKALPNSLSRQYDRLVVACPSFVPAPRERRELESLDVFVVPLGAPDPFLLDYSAALRKPARKAPRVVLSDDEEEEFERLGFKSRLPIRITGRIERRKGNVIDVAGHSVVLTDAPFKMLLRLVVALCETTDGFLSRNELTYGAGIDSEGVLAPDGLDQALSRLRAPFQPALEGLQRTHFIEARSSHVRLSTYRRYVTWDREALRGHQDGWVRGLAARLPEGW
jgi:hypothetical protein